MPESPATRLARLRRENATWVISKTDPLPQIFLAVRFVAGERHEIRAATLDELENRLNEEDQMNITAKNGQMGAKKARVTFDGQLVTIKRGTWGRSEARLPVSRITMVGWHKTLTGGGHIEFVAAGIDGKVRFRQWHLAEFERLRAAVDEAITGQVVASS